jgi:hypothetical protein
MDSPPVSCCFGRLGPKHSPLRPVLKHSGLETIIQTYTKLQANFRLNVVTGRLRRSFYRGQHYTRNFMSRGVGTPIILVHLYQREPKQRAG